MRLQKADGREQRRADQEREGQELIPVFELCCDACACGFRPCPMEKAARCVSCQRISTTGRLCSKCDFSAAWRGTAPQLMCHR